MVSAEICIDYIFRAGDNGGTFGCIEKTEKQAWMRFRKRISRRRLGSPVILRIIRPPASRGLCNESLDNYTTLFPTGLPAISRIHPVVMNLSGCHRGGRRGENPRNRSTRKDRPSMTHLSRPVTNPIWVGDPAQEPNPCLNQALHTERCNMVRYRERYTTLTRSAGENRT